MVYYLGTSCAGIAQLVEQLICNQQVGGSSPSTSSKKGRIVRKDGSSFFICNGLEPERVCGKEKVACGKFFPQSGEAGYCCQGQRSASHKYVCFARIDLHKFTDCSGRR